MSEPIYRVAFNASPPEVSAQDVIMRQADASDPEFLAKQQSRAHNAAQAYLEKNLAPYSASEVSSHQRAMEERIAKLEKELAHERNVSADAGRLAKAWNDRAVELYAKLDDLEDRAEELRGRLHGAEGDRAILDARWRGWRKAFWTAILTAATVGGGLGFLG